MAKTRTPPYRFPVTVVIVDDDPDFLTNFALELGDDLAYRLVDTPVGPWHSSKTSAAACRRCTSAASRRTATPWAGPCATITCA